jgi:NAD(P)-dependent dehydrogenase (short-subunit alcohol dehydrogenase family)
MPRTGGAKGIGYACAACLGHEGAQVVIADIDETAAQQAAQRLQLEGVAASAFRCDVGVKDEVGEYAVVITRYVR